VRAVTNPFKFRISALFEMAEFLLLYRGSRSSIQGSISAA